MWKYPPEILPMDGQHIYVRFYYPDAVPVTGIYQDATFEILLDTTGKTYPFYLVVRWKAV